MSDAMDQPERIWITFVGVLDLPIARGLTEVLTQCKVNGAKEIHLLIQSPGGNVSEGVYLFNFFKSFPIPVFTYNSGNVSSAATIAYLGGRKRIASSNSAFLIHRAKVGPGISGNSAQMQSAATSLEIDDARTRAILDATLTLTDAQKAIADHADLNISADDAITAGIAHEIGLFCPVGVLINV